MVHQDGVHVAGGAETNKREDPTDEVVPVTLLGSRLPVSRDVGLSHKTQDLRMLPFAFELRFPPH